MPRAGLEPAIPATKRPQTYALDRAATGIGLNSNYFERIWKESVVYYLTFYPRICIEGWRKIENNLRLHRRSPGTDLNPGPSKYRVLTPRQRRSLCCRRIVKATRHVGWASPSHITVDGHQPVCLGVEPLLGLMTRFYCHRFDCYGPLSRGAPHLTRGRVCLLSEVCLCHL
jgi:hypothetical protein